MRQLILVLSLLLSNSMLFGQTFVGSSTDKMKAYQCMIRINKDSTVDFIYERNQNAVYATHTGRIKKINDTLFHVAARMTVGQFLMKGSDKDTLEIQMDSAIAMVLDKIEITYSNKTHSGQLQGYNRQGKPLRCFKIPIDRRIFNHNKGSDFVTIVINSKDLITGKCLGFRIPFGSAASFIAGQQEEFDVIIKNGRLVTTGTPPLQTRHFNLRMK